MIRVRGPLVCLSALFHVEPPFRREPQAVRPQPSQVEPPRPEGRRS